MHRNLRNRKSSAGCVQVVREHYLRDDISCGALFCPECDTSKAALRQTAENILVVDTNVVLHQVRIFYLLLSFFKFVQVVQSASVGGRDDFVQSVLHCHCFSSVIFRSWFLSWFLWIFGLWLDCGLHRWTFWRTRLLVMWWCYQWCWRRWRTRTWVCTIVCEPLLTIQPATFLCLQMNITSRPFSFILSLPYSFHEFLTCKNVDPICTVFTPLGSVMVLSSA